MYYRLSCALQSSTLAVVIAMRPGSRKRLVCGKFAKWLCKSGIASSLIEAPRNDVRWGESQPNIARNGFYQTFPAITFADMELSNLLPYDGEVNYYGRVMDAAEADRYLEVLLNTIAWKNDEARIFGRHIITKRKVAWYGDNNFSYAYSGATRVALPWTAELLELKTLTEQLTGEVYNSCLLNLYHTGDEGMAWHSDDEKALGKDSTIASLSFGAERKFSLKHRVNKDESRSVILEAGSLLVMKGTTQSNWLHSLPKQQRVKTPRVNLTFRSMIPQI